MIKPDLDALVREWKPIFGCSDWRITCRYVAALPDAMAVARCLPLWKYLEASIEIVDPTTREHDVEETLVHELGHLPFAPFETVAGSFEEAMEERAVETWARGLIALKRNKAPAPLQAMARRQITSKLVGARMRLATGKARSRMSFDAARFGEIMMELGALPDLPDPAKALISELAGMAAGGGPASEVDAAMKEEPKPGDAATMPMGGAYRQKADAYAKKRMLIEQGMAADSARAKARQQLGARCTPALEKRLIAMTEPDAIESTVTAILEADGAQGKAREKIREPTDPKTGAKPSGPFTARLQARGVLAGGAQ